MTMEDFNVRTKVRLLVDLPTQKKAPKSSSRVTVEGFHGDEPIGSGDLRSALHESLDSLYSEEPAVRAALLFLLTREETIGINLGHSPGVFLGKMKRLVTKLAKGCNGILEISGKKMHIVAPSGDEREIELVRDDPRPSCVRWVWEDGELVAKYNYEIVIVDGLDESFDPAVLLGETRLTLHAAVHAYVPMERIKWGPDED